MAHRITIPRTPKKNKFDLLKNAKFDIKLYTRTTQAAASAISLHGYMTGYEAAESRSKARQADMILGMRPSQVVRDELKDFKVDFYS